MNEIRQKMWNASRFCVSSLRRGHANLLCIVPILVYVFRMEYILKGWQLDYLYTKFISKTPMVNNQQLSTWNHFKIFHARFLWIRKDEL